MIPLYGIILHTIGGDFISVEIKDAEGNVVATGGVEACEHANLLIAVKEPHLWNGMEDPYCYTAVVKLLAGEEVVDEVLQSAILNQNWKRLQRL